MFDFFFLINLLQQQVTVIITTLLALRLQIHPTTNCARNMHNTLFTGCRTGLQEFTQKDIFLPKKKLVQFFFLEIPEQ